MFYIRKRSIKYFETSRGVAFTAHLLQSGTDVHMGMVDQRGVGGFTTFEAANEHVHKMVQVLAKKCGVREDQLMDCYMDLAEGLEPLNIELAAKLTIASN